MNDPRPDPIETRLRKLRPGSPPDTLRERVLADAGRRIPQPGLAFRLLRAAAVLLIVLAPAVNTRIGRLRDETDVPRVSARPTPPAEAIVAGSPWPLPLRSRPRYDSADWICYLKEVATP